MRADRDRRTKAKISPLTIRKEIASFRAAWNWGLPMDLTSGIFPNRGLRYPKANEKPPFMTWAEIKRAISHGGSASEAWDWLYLLPDELAELLEYVKDNADHGWIYPMFRMAHASPFIHLGLCKQRRGPAANRRTVWAFHRGAAKALPPSFLGRAAERDAISVWMIAFCFMFTVCRSFRCH
jgi:hypothetical protein